MCKEEKLSWKNVGFTYDQSNVFKDFNVTINDGERVGLVGPSGAGKTTFRLTSFASA